MKRAMLLAAGRGERLKPLTDDLPKPLLQIGDTSLIEHNLIKLKSAGIEEVVINVCYRAKQIMEQVGDGKRYGLKIIFSHEPEKPLGTGGGVLQALQFLKDDPFILLSSDIWTDYPFEQLQLSPGNLAHLVMVKNPSYCPQGDYFLGTDQYLYLDGAPKLTYGNIAVIHPNFFKGSRALTFPLSDLFSSGIQSKKISAELYQGAWFNVGTVQELELLERSLSVI